MHTNNPLNTPFIPPLAMSNHEKHLFDLHKYPIINIQSCIKNMNADQESFFSILHTLLTQEFPTEKAAYTRAHQQGKWEKIEKLAHKMKGGAMYTGLVKLQYACQHFEDYYQSDKTLLLEGLYQQIIYVMQETHIELEALVANSTSYTSRGE